MIISRRKIHLFSSIVLAIMMPIIFIAGILLRPTDATVIPDTDQLLSHTKERKIVVQPLKKTVSDQNPITVFLEH